MATYKPRDFNFSDIGTGLPSWIFQEKPMDLNDAISEANKIKEQELLNQAREQQIQDAQEAQQQQEAYKQIDPEGRMSSEELLKEAEKISWRAGDARTATTLAEREMQREYNRQRLNKPEIRSRKDGSIVQIGPDGTEVIVPGQPTREKQVLLEKDGVQQFVDQSQANEALSQGWKKAGGGGSDESFLAGLAGGGDSGGSNSSEKPDFSIIERRLPDGTTVKVRKLPNGKYIEVK